MIEIERESAVPSEPYANLTPIVDFLHHEGNTAFDGGFLMAPDGWRCRVRDPIDFDAVKR
jgi:hypothetical protein